MATKKKKSAETGFTSLRIISEHAHRLLEKAKLLQRRRRDTEETLTEHSQEDDIPTVTIHLSIGSVVRGACTVLAIVAGVCLLYFLLDKLVVLILAAFVAIIIDPGVQKLQSWGIPKG